MIIKNGKTISSVYKGSQVIDKIYKGTLVVYESFKNLVASGVPLTLLNCKGVDLIDYKLYGNSEQKSKNLLEGVEVGNYSTSGNNTTNNKRLRSKGYIKVKPNTKYTISWETTDTTNLVKVAISDFAEQGQERTRVQSWFTSPTTFTTQGTTNYIRLMFIATTEKEMNVEDIYNVQVEEGETTTDYVPYLPTPETPIEVESVGDKTKNLAKSTGNVLGTITPTTGVINPFYEYATTSDFISLKAGTYIINCNDGVKLRNVVVFNKNKELLSNFWTNRVKPYTFTLNEDCFIRFDIERAGLVDVENLETCFKDYEVQIEQGTKATEYEHYGYRIPVKVSGKNLFDDVYFKTRSNYKIIWSGGYASAKVILKPNTKYTIQPYRITGITKPTTNMFYKVGNSTTEPASCTNIGSYVSSSGNYSYAKATVTTNEDGIIYFHASSNATQEIIDKIFTYFYFQLVEGTTVPAYEPYHEPITTNIYLNEPLRKVKDTYINDEPTDYIDFEKKQVVRNITKIILDGTQKFSPNTRVVEGYDTYHTYYNQELPSGLRTNASVMSNKLIGNYTWSIAKDYKREQIAPAPASFTLRIAQSRGVEHSADGINNWLKENPIDVLFILETPTYEDVELPNIPTFKGTTILSVDTTIQPSNLEAVYKGKGNNQILSVETNSVLNSILGSDTETEIDITNTEINEILDEIIGG